MNDPEDTRVLIAEDDYMVARELARHLTLAGYSVVGKARDGNEAVQMAADLLPDVAILDLDMPGQGGIEAAKRIRAQRPIPLVIVTAYQSLALVKRVGNVGAGGYLVKPVDGPELVRAIQVARARFDELEELRGHRHHLEELVAERTAELRETNTALRRSLRAKDRLMANMSHELRTPLNAILGLSEALLEQVYGSLTTKQRESLATIENSGHRLLSLVNDVIDLTRLESKEVKLDMRDNDVAEMCEAVQASVRARADSQEHKLCLSVSHDVGLLCCDAQRLRQILVNLLDNAIKFTPAGGEVGLQVDVLPDEAAVSFTVWDTGPGIVAQQVAAVGEPFTQASSGLARQHQGAGLGLALVSRLTELHGGRLEFTHDNDGDSGSRVTVVVPRATHTTHQG